MCREFIDNNIYNGMINKRLKNIADIVAGYTFRTALQTQKDGKALVVRAKDISNLFIEDQNLIKVDHQKYKTKAVIKKNDVIISVRGKFQAGVYKGDLKNIIASSSVYILRITDVNVLSEYLAIYLNSKIGQREINKTLTGGAIKTILRKDLENLNIVIPEIKKQKTIIDLYKNNLKLQEKLDVKQRLINNITETAIGKIINK